MTMHEFSLYLNEEVFDEDNFDEEELKKASDIIHQYFNKEVIIKLSNNYQLVFEPIGFKDSQMVGKIISSDVSNLQNYIHMLRFRKIKVVNSSPQDKAKYLNNLLQSCFRSSDIDGFSSYNPNFIPNVINSLKSSLFDCYEQGRLVFVEKPVSKKLMKKLYQVLREVSYILELYFYCPQ